MNLSDNPVAQVILEEALYGISYHSAALRRPDILENLKPYHLVRLNASIAQWNLGLSIPSDCPPLE